MAKKVFQKRLNASLCAVYEDISDDEFDPTEIQFSTEKKPFSNYTALNPFYAYNDCNQAQKKYFSASPEDSVYTPINHVSTYFSSPSETSDEVFEFQDKKLSDYIVDKSTISISEKPERIKKEPEEFEQEESNSDEYNLHIPEEYIKEEPEEEYSELEYSECEDVPTKDIEVKKEPMMKGEEKIESDNDMSKKEELSRIPKSEDDPRKNQVKEVVKQKVSQFTDKKINNEKLLLGWSDDASEDETQESVTNDEVESSSHETKALVKVSPNSSPTTKANNSKSIEMCGFHDLGQKNRNLVHSAECACNGNVSSSSSYLYKNIPNVSYKVSKSTKENDAHHVENTSQNTSISGQKLNRKTSDTISDEPPKKKEKTSNFSSRNTGSQSETTPNKLINHWWNSRKESMSSDKIVNSSYPRSPYFFIKPKFPFVDPRQVEVTPSKYSPESTRAQHVKLLACPHCTRKYWKESELKEHIKQQHTEIVKVETDQKHEISRCPECKEQLKTKVEMYVHRLTHIVPEFKKLKCLICDQNQFTFDGLKQHVRAAHKIQDKWFCPICPEVKTFTQRNGLLIHISTYHFDSRREEPSTFSCSKCLKVFSSKALLGKHVNNTHLGPSITEIHYKMFKCDVCGKSYEKLCQLHKHLKARHMNNQVLSRDEAVTRSDLTTGKLLLSKNNIVDKLPRINLGM